MNNIRDPQKTNCTKTFCEGHQIYVECNTTKKLFKVFDSRDVPWQLVVKELDERLTSMELELDVKKGEEKSTQTIPEFSPFLE